MVVLKVSFVEFLRTFYVPSRDHPFNDNLIEITITINEYNLGK